MKKQALLVIGFLALNVACAPQNFGKVPDTGAGGKAATAGTNGAEGGVGQGGAGTDPNGNVGQGGAGTDPGGSVGQGGAGTDPGGSVGQGGASGGGGTMGGGGNGAGGSDSPLFHYEANDCAINATLCPFNIVLAKPVSKVLVISWHTVDKSGSGAAQTPVANRPGYVHARQDVDYTYSSGTVTFEPGATSMSDNIHSLNRTKHVVFDLTAVQCTYGGQAVDCGSIFQSQ